MPNERDSYQDSIDDPVAGSAGTGLITQPHSRNMPPAMVAEQQRAKSEIEAALTIAAARPRDEKEALDRILLSCQRPNLAAKAHYQYAKGGTDIVAPSIDLMEVIAQHWGNLEFGFRELARFPGTRKESGESVVEAFSWDLQTNTRRRTQFTIPHSIETKQGLRAVTGPRDIYECVANQAQRRVRTCLENIIPRDIIEAASEECQRTLQAKIDLTPETISKLIAAFATFGVTKAALETRIQRRMESITAAQVVYLRKIWTSLRDGMSEPADWFEMAPAASSATTEDQSDSPATSDDAQEAASLQTLAQEAVSFQALTVAWDRFSAAASIDACRVIGLDFEGREDLPGATKDKIVEMWQKREEELRFKANRDDFQKVLAAAQDVPAATRILEGWIPQLADEDHPWARKQATERKKKIREAESKSATEAGA